MHPTVFDLGMVDLPVLGPTHLFLPTYGVIFAVGTLIAWSWFLRRARRLDLPQDTVFNLAFYALLAGLVGAKLTLILVDSAYYLENPREILGTLRSAGVLMGGVLFGAVAFVLYARRHKLPVLELGDAIIAPVALAQGIGRLGCFAAGCCYGIESHAWCAVRFVSEEAHAQTGVPLATPILPVQLFELAFDLALALLLTTLWRRRVRPAGTAVWVYLVVYGAGRGVLELWRGDAVRGLWLGGAVSTSQIFSALSIVIGLVFLVRDRVRIPRPA